MASHKGKQRSFNLRYKQPQELAERRSEQVRRNIRADGSRVAKLGPPRHMDDQTSPWTQRRDLVFSYLRDSATRHASKFFIVSEPGSNVIPSEYIERHAQIFDEFVGTAWNVSVVYGLGANGEPGWVFER